jgi:hypothetical protein
MRIVNRLLLCAALLATAMPTWALQVAPTYQVFQAKPGGKVEGQMTVTNNEGEAVTLVPSVKNWFKLNVNAEHDVEKWLRLDEDKEFTLKPGESRLIKYTLVAPKKAKGELAGAVTFSTKPKANMITMQLSVVQYLGLVGTEKAAMEVEGVGVLVSSNTQVGVVVKNEGNVHIRPAGFIYVEDTGGQRLLNVEIPVGQPAFPGANRLYSGTVKGFRLKPGSYVARIELSDVDRPIKYPTVTKKFSVNEEGKVDSR